MAQDRGIDKLPSGEHRVRFTLDGRRRTRIFDNLNDARDFTRTLGRAAGPDLGEEAQRLDAWVGEWFPVHAVGIKCSSVWTYKRAFNTYVLPYLGGLYLGEAMAAVVLR